MNIDRKGNVICDAHGRWLYLFGYINQETAEQFARFLHGAQARTSDWSRPVTILINSYGGDSVASLLIYSMLVDFLSPVITVSFGQACSGAFIVFESGKRRIMVPGAKLKFHRAAWRAVKGGTLNIEELDYMREKIKCINARLHCVVQKRSRQKAEMIKDFFLKEKVFEAKDAIKYNLADKIIPWKDIPELPTRVELSKLLGEKI